MAKSGQKILVAMDVFNPLSRSLKNALTTVQALTKQGNFDSQAIAVLSPVDVAWPTSFSPSWQAHFASMGREKLEAELKKLKFRSDEKPRLLVQRQYSKRISAEQLALEANELNSDMVVLFTHANKEQTLSPFGSFAETVASHASVPVLCVNAMARPVTKIKTALFATDFSPAAKVAFDKAVVLAKAMKFKIRLFHYLFQPTYALAFAGAPFVPPVPQLSSVFDAQEAEVRNKAESWALEARKAGVEVEIEIVDGIKDPGTEILKATQGTSKKSADLVIVVPQVSPIAGLVIGSTTRKVLRQSKKPVLLIHADDQSEGRKHAERQVSRSNNNETYRNTM